MVSVGIDGVVVGSLGGSSDMLWGEESSNADSGVRLSLGWWGFHTSLLLLS